jgi:hypothetical protein
MLKTALIRRPDPFVAAPSRFSVSCPSTSEKLRQKTKLIFSSIEKKWQYLGKLNQLSRYGLNISLKVGKWSKEAALRARITKSISALKLFSFISIPLNLMSIPDLIQKIGTSFKYRDREGIALGVVSVVALAADTIDSVSTSLGGLISLLCKTPIAFFVLIGSPLIVMMLGAGAVLRVAHLYHLGSFSRKIKKLEKTRSSEEMQSSLKALLKKELGIEGEKEKRDIVFKRHTNQDLLNQMKELEKFVADHENFTEAEVQSSQILIKRIRNLIDKEVAVERMKLTMIAITSIAFGLTFVPGANIIPLVLFATSTLMKLAVQTYEDWPKIKKASDLRFGHRRQIAC